MKKNKIILHALSFVKGAVSGINPVIGGVVGAAEGVVKSIKEEKEANLEDGATPKGQIDWARLTGTVVFLSLVTAFLFGKITLDDVMNLFKAFTKNVD